MRKERFKARWALSVFFATVLISISCVKNDPQTTIEEPMLGTKPFSSDLARSLQKSFERDYQETRVRSISDADTTLYLKVYLQSGSLLYGATALLRIKNTLKCQ